VIDVTVLVADDHLEAIDEVAAALREAGLRVDQALPSTGVITGSVEDATAMQSLSSIPGVATVESAQEIQLPPPDAPVQ
jgi:hypothetical protein